MNNLTSTFKFLNYTPLMFNVVFYIGIFLAFLHFGHIPTLNDYGYETIPFFYVIIYLLNITIAFTIMSLIIWPVILFIIIKKKMTINKFDIILFFIFLILAFFSLIESIGDWYAG
jgi:hypothetical protein